MKETYPEKTNSYLNCSVTNIYRSLSEDVVTVGENRENFLENTKFKLSLRSVFS